MDPSLLCSCNGQSVGEGNHEDDSPSAEFQHVGEENNSLSRHLSEMQTKVDKKTERMRSLRGLIDSC